MNNKFTSLEETVIRTISDTYFHIGLTDIGSINIYIESERYPTRTLRSRVEDLNICFLNGNIWEARILCRDIRHGLVYNVLNDRITSFTRVAVQDCINNLERLTNFLGNISS